MQGQNMWWSYWYFHFPNYAFSVLFWTLIGRFMFGMFLPPDSPNYIYRWFRRLTDWLMRPVAFITPSIVPPVRSRDRRLLGCHGAGRVLHGAVRGWTDAAHYAVSRACSTVKTWFR